MTTRARAITSVAVCAGATMAFVGLGTSPAAGGGLAILLAAFAGYVGFLRWQRRAPALSGPVVLGVCALMLIGAVVFPPRLSNDYRAYALYGRIVSEHDANPYRHRPIEFASDPFFRHLDPVWHRSRTVYGPAFTGLSATGTSLISSPLGLRLFYQSLAAIAVFGSLLLLWRATRDPFVVGLVGLHPATSASIVNGAHNDALVGLAVLAGVLLVRARRDVLGGAALAGGALVKIVGLFPLIGVVVWTLVRRGWRAALAVGAPAGALFVAAYTVVGPFDAMRALSANARLTTAHSIPRLLGPRVTEGAGDAADLVRAAAVGVVALAIVTIALSARASSLPVVAGVALLAYLLCAAYVLPWYAAWILPVLALDHRSVPARAAVLMAALLMLVYWPVRLGAGERLLSPFIRTGMPLIELALVGVVAGALWRTHLRFESKPDARADTIS